DAHPARVVGYVIDAIRRGAAEFRNQEVMHAHIFRLALGTIFATRVLEVADEFLLFGVDRNCRLFRSERALHSIVDVMKLCVAIWMARAFQRLAIALKAVSHLA